VVRLLPRGGSCQHGSYCGFGGVDCVGDDEPAFGNADLLAGLARYDRYQLRDAATIARASRRALSRELGLAGRSETEDYEGMQPQPDQHYRHRFPAEIISGNATTTYRKPYPNTEGEQGRISTGRAAEASPP
jgi:hypothetical protein